MDLWHLVLYAVGSFLALRSLVSLMTHYKRHYRQQFQLEAAMNRHRELQMAGESVSASDENVVSAEIGDAAA